MAEVDLLLLLVELEHREVDDPAEAEGTLLDQAELLGDAGARGSGEPGRFLGLGDGGRRNRPAVAVGTAATDNAGRGGVSADGGPRS